MSFHRSQCPAISAYKCIFHPYSLQPAPSWIGWCLTSQWQRSWWGGESGQ